MSCLTLSSGICRGCRDNAGGVKAVFAANLCGVNWGGMVTNTDGEVTELTLSMTQSWYYLMPNKNTSNWVENINSSVENGTLYYEQVVTAVFGKMDQSLRNTINEMCASELALIVVDNNNTMWLIGSDGNGAIVTGGNSASGTALGDLNGWTINLTCNARNSAVVVSPSESSALKTALDAAKAACGC